jgi:uncharacterized protein
VTVKQPVTFLRKDQPTTTVRPNSLAFHVLAKPSGAICNLDCTYCFFLDKADLYPDSIFRMELPVLRAYLTQLFEVTAGDEITISWQGGEPTLLGKAWFERAVELANSLKPPRVRLLHTMQTNATLIDDDWAQLLAKHQFLVGVSIDGPPALHDAFRVDKKGGPTSDRVLRGLKALQRRGVEVNALVTVNSANMDHGLEVYRYFRDELQLRYFQFIPIVEHTDGVISAESVTPQGWGSFLTTVFDEWFRHDVGEVYVSMIDAALAPLVGAPAGMCIFAETCGDAIALEHNGDVYSCDHFVDPEHLLGNVLSNHLGDLVTSAAQRGFGRAKKSTLPSQCTTCPVLSQCRGECPKNRLFPSETGDGAINYLCAGYLQYFTHANPVLKLMARQLMAGGYADEVPELVFSAPADQRCPCGSGTPRGVCHLR